MANSCGARIMNFKGGDGAAAGFRSIGANASTLMGGRRRKSRRSGRKSARKSARKSKKSRKTRKSRKSRKSRK